MTLMLHVIWNKKYWNYINATTINLEHLTFTLFSILSEIIETSLTFMRRKKKKKSDGNPNIHTDCLQSFYAFKMCTSKCDWVKRLSAAEVTRRLGGEWKAVCLIQLVSSDHAEELRGALRSSARPNRWKRRRQQQARTHLWVWQVHTVTQIILESLTVLFTRKGIKVF